MSYAEDQLLPLSALTDIAFCERRAALHQLEQIWTDNVATTEGHILHDKVHDSGVESRGDVRIVRGLRLRSLRIGLTGVADVVEFHAPQADRSAPWRPFPVEYKRGVQRRERSFEIQLCGQAMCLEEMLELEVPAGALFYGISRRRTDVEFTRELRSETETAARRLHALVDAGVTPKAVYEKKCEKCSLKQVCMPQTAGAGKSAAGYLKLMLEGGGPLPSRSDASQSGGRQSFAAVSEAANDRPMAIGGRQSFAAVSGNAKGLPREDGGKELPREDGGKGLPREDGGKGLPREDGGKGLPPSRGTE